MLAPSLGRMTSLTNVRLMPSLTSKLNFHSDSRLGAKSSQELKEDDIRAELEEISKKRVKVGRHWWR